MTTKLNKQKIDQIEQNRSKNMDKYAALLFDAEGSIGTVAPEIIKLEKETTDNMYKIRDFFINEIYNDHVKKRLGKKIFKMYVEKFDETVKITNLREITITNYERMKSNGFYDYIIKKYGDKGRESLFRSLYSTANEIEIIGIIKNQSPIAILDALYEVGVFDDEDEEHCKNILDIIKKQNYEMDKLIKEIREIKN